MKDRQEKDLPLAIDEWGWKYHHLGVPTNEKKAAEKYLSEFKFSVSGFKTSPFGIEWMRFDKDCQMPNIIKELPHLAFVVEDLDFELSNRGLNVIVEPNSPMNGIRVAMIEHDGAPIELMEINRFI
ncbi:MAG: hypothetical protein QNK35_17535 [Bacteroides sp.]|nr:hypothetical protein [Bacteroides sp.]